MPDVPCFLLDDFAEWLDKAAPGDSCVVMGHPGELDGLRKAALKIAARLHVDVRTAATALDTEFRVDVVSMDPYARLEPREHARVLFSAASKPGPGTLVRVTCRPGRKRELLRQLQLVYSQAGYNIHDFAEKETCGRGEFMLRFTRRFTGAKPGPATAPLLQSPDDLEAKGLLRLDSKNLPAEQSGPQEGAGEFTAGARS